MTESEKRSQGTEDIEEKGVEHAPRPRKVSRDGIPWEKIRPRLTRIYEQVVALSAIISWTNRKSQSPYHQRKK